MPNNDSKDSILDVVEGYIKELEAHILIEKESEGNVGKMES